MLSCKLKIVHFTLYLLYSEAIQDAVRQFGFSETNTKITVEMLYKGTSYNKGTFLVTRNIDSMEFSELVLILIQNDTVHFLVSRYITEFLSQYHLYSVRKDNDQDAVCEHKGPD